MPSMTAALHQLVDLFVMSLVVSLAALLSFDLFTFIFAERATEYLVLKVPQI